jgi:hypothetical protein
MMPDAFREPHDLGRYVCMPYYSILRKQVDNIYPNEEANRSRDICGELCIIQPEENNCCVLVTLTQKKAYEGWTIVVKTSLDCQPPVRVIMRDNKQMKLIIVGLHMASSIYMREMHLLMNKLCEAVVWAIEKTFENARYLVTSEAQCRTRNGEFAMCWSVCCAT